MKLDARRAIEALRAGVPNRDAVHFLGSGQPALTDRFELGLVELRKDGEPPHVHGFLLAGDFGSGKSHLLQYLKQEALRQGFATSLVVISKETPLSDLDLVYKAAVKELSLPDRQGGDLYEVVLRLDNRPGDYAQFYRTVMQSDSALALNPLFAATLLLHERISTAEELHDRIQGFWSGGRISVAEIRRALRPFRDVGLAVGAYKNADLADQRFLFASGLIRAAGYRGWVLLLDEVELVAKFPLRGRARSYVNLDWLLGNGDRPIPGLYAIGAATQDFTGEVLGKKQDHVKIPTALAEKDPRLAQLAARALSRIADDDAEIWESIVPQSDDDLDRVYGEVRELYRLAFDWESHDARRQPSSDVRRSMRMHVREWITRWDLERLDPSYSADIEAEALRPDLAEGQGLEGFSESDPSDDNGSSAGE